MAGIVRALLRLDDPAAHLSGRQFAAAALIGIAVASAVGWIMRSLALGGWLFVQLATAAWLTPRAREQMGRRAAYSLGWAVVLAGLFALARRVAGPWGPG